MKLFAISVLTAFALAANPVLAEDRSGKCGGCDKHSAASHEHSFKNYFRALEDAIKNHMNDPIGTGDLTVGDQLGGDIDNALADGKINQRQYDKLNRDYSRATGGFSGKSGAVGSDDIGGIP